MLSAKQFFCSEPMTCQDYAKIAYLRELIVDRPIRVVRVSSAQARGRAKSYSYWGAARCVIRLNRNGHPTLVVQKGACSDRRSERLAEEDARRIAQEEGCLYVGRMPVGPLSAQDAAYILDLFLSRYHIPSATRFSH